MTPAILEMDMGGISSVRAYLPCTKVGFSLRKELGKTFSLEAGIFGLDFYDSFQRGDIRVHTNSHTPFVFPLKLNISKRLISERLFLYSSLGAQYFVTYGGGGSGVRYLPGENESLKQEHWSGFGHHVQLISSLGLRYKVVDELLLSLSVGYAHGFKNVRHYYLTYMIDDVVIEEMQAESQGNYWDITMGLSYPLGRGFMLLGSAYNRLMDNE